MTTRTICETRVALALKAYGIELRLWKEPGEHEWGAALRDDNAIVECHFEEDNLTLAKLYILGEARCRAMRRACGELPSCDTYLNSWKPIKMTKAGLEQKPELPL